ncbi:uncharacterized protein [Aegilops tauschii subsp. strangulata]|uniref:uncharacterized protein n=1 Tax=Aegilops tauschii subsp. strangulata TaxID=200361 RepID=UPI003CC86F37
MANWFPLALKDGARSWLMNLPSWAKLCDQFIANFKGTHDRPITGNDLQHVRQRPGETLHKYIQRFSQVRHKVPHGSDEAIISAFSTGITDVRMHEKLAINDDLDSVLELFNLADRCTKAKESHLFIHNNPDAAPDDNKSKSKDVKRKGPALLAVEPEKDNRPFRVYHNMRTHNIED